MCVAVNNFPPDSNNNRISVSSGGFSILKADIGTLGVSFLANLSNRTCTTSDSVINTADAALWCLWMNWTSWILFIHNTFLAQIPLIRILSLLYLSQEGAGNAMKEAKSVQIAKRLKNQAITFSWGVLNLKCVHPLKVFLCCRHHLRIIAYLIESLRSVLSEDSWSATEESGHYECEQCSNEKWIRYSIGSFFTVYLFLHTHTSCDYRFQTPIKLFLNFWGQNQFHINLMMTAKTRICN